MWSFQDVRQCSDALVNKSSDSLSIEELSRVRVRQGKEERGERGSHSDENYL